MESCNVYLCTFVALFLFRYMRAVVNLIAYLRYRPVPIPAHPSYLPSDVTIVVCTGDLYAGNFQKVIKSILIHPIGKLIVATAGEKALSQIKSFEEIFNDPRMMVFNRQERNRREQTAMAVKFIETKLMIISDDHTFFPPGPLFLPSVLAPFENPKVGGVGPVLEAAHHHHWKSFTDVVGYWEGYWNFMGMTYLLRRAHEFVATTSIDGGLSCLSSRFAVFRTEIYANPDFLYHYLNEWVNGVKLNADDDKFHTRWLATHDWDIKIQGGPESIMTTELGVYPDFPNRCVCWTRTTFRSNPRALKDITTMIRFPYTYYAILIYSYCRVSLFHELALSVLLYMGLAKEWFVPALCTFHFWCTGMKLAKIWPHFKKRPWDLWYFFPYLIFAWGSSGVKVWAYWTREDASWEARANGKSLPIEKGGKFRPEDSSSDGEKKAGETTPPTDYASDKDDGVKAGVPK